MSHDAIHETTGFLVSLVVHTVLVLVLAWWAVRAPTLGDLTLVVDTRPSPTVAPEDMTVAMRVSPWSADADQVAVERVWAPPATIDLPADAVVFGPTSSPWVPTGEASTSAELLRGGAPVRGGFEGRRGDRKAERLARGGGTPASESAVALALAWLAAHQESSGGWRFDLSEAPCRNQCRNGGTVGSTTGATGLALLPFLGAGQTHRDGDYRDVVHAGLYYLKEHAVPTPHGADLQEGTMYAQGIATIALCEAYGMTQDDSLRSSAQRAIDFICWAQHSAGGWRYYPGQPGDTTVFGWQMMALKSATMAGLDVPSPVVNLGERFLDSVQSGDGSYYGYLTPGRTPGTTAVGLLVRMYTGWRRNDSRLSRGVEFLSREGPSKSDMYYNYYATQVLHHFDGPTWPAWNDQMRDYLVRTQATAGHERGSWFFQDQHGLKGGRLYTTAMCAMILEVYYRHMPLYETVAVEDDL
ncbi:MAG: hypothetical protein MUF48_03535 [Pirellulaceae bacterium]|jgi:hypothetical protein|nr:hypothetical protein [Pirellulaceae bacterium]